MVSNATFNSNEGMLSIKLSICKICIKIKQFLEDSLSKSSPALPPEQQCFLHSVAG